MNDKEVVRQLCELADKQEEMLQGLFNTLACIAREQGMNTDNIVWYSKVEGYLNKKL